MVNNIQYSSVFFVGVVVDTDVNGYLWSGILVMAAGYVESGCYS
jgi:hypothetical protein